MSARGPRGPGSQWAKVVRCELERTLECLLGPDAPLPQLLETAQLQALDTADVEPLAHGIEVRNVFRDDVRGEALPREAALANAPRRNAEGFLVPAVLE